VSIDVGVEVHDLPGLLAFEARSMCGLQGRRLGGLACVEIHAPLARSVNDTAT